MTYIIRKGSPESLLLSKFGLNRNNLIVLEWKGRKKSNGGFGKSPISWRLTDVASIQILCEGIMKYYGGENETKINNQERQSLAKARRTLAIIEKGNLKVSKFLDEKLKRNIHLVPYLRSRYPLLQDEELSNLTNLINLERPSSLIDVDYLINYVMGDITNKWDCARKSFIYNITTNFPEK
jgi:hypothetical protein